MEKTFGVFLTILLHMICVSTKGSEQNSTSYCGDNNFSESWRVFVYSKTSKERLSCSGVLVSDKHVILPVVCSKYFTVPDVEVVVGEKIYQIENVVEDVTPHVLLSFSPALNFSDPNLNVRPVCLPDQDDNFDQNCRKERPKEVFCSGGNCTVPGWFFNTSGPSTVLLGIQMNKCPAEDEEEMIFTRIKASDKAIMRRKFRATFLPMKSSATFTEQTVKVKSFFRVSGNDRKNHPRQFGQFPNYCPSLAEGPENWYCDPNGSSEGVFCGPTDFELIQCPEEALKCKVQGSERYVPLREAQQRCWRLQDLEETTTFYSSEIESETEKDTEAKVFDELYFKNKIQSCKQTRCRFPFYYKNQARFECINLENSSDDLMCPTHIESSTLEGLQWVKCDSSCPLMKFHTHKELMEDLDDVVAAFPDHAKNFSLGKSQKNQDLYGIRLSKNLNINLNSGQGLGLIPMVKYVGNMHGNEPTGRELIIHLAKYILGLADLNDSEHFDGFRDEIKNDIRRMSKLLSETDLWILPTMNPDGFNRSSEGECFGGSYFEGRLNEGRMDLNRDFPGSREKDELQRNPFTDIYFKRQIETRHLMRWILNNSFVLSANFHDGAVLANYPFDDYHGSSSRSGPNLTPDHDVFYELALTYSRNHATMNNATENCTQWGPFENGITNGADWYEVIGGMQDFNYLFANTMELTLELSCCKFPPRSRLLPEWNNNIRSLIAYIEQAQRGIKGYVTDLNNLPVENAQIRIKKHHPESSHSKWRSKNVKSNKDGKYWRILVPGNYTVQAIHPQKAMVSRPIEIAIDGPTSKVVNFILEVHSEEFRTTTPSPWAGDFLSPIRRRFTQGNFFNT